MARNPRYIDRDLQALYDALPTLECQGKCQESCGPIAMSARERENAERALGAGVNADNERLECSALHHGRCAIYAQRPMVCRLWGMTEKMPCPWGCRPSRMLPDREASAFLRASLHVGGREPLTPTLQALRAITEQRAM